MTVRTRPSPEGAVSYGYDLLGRVTSASDGASGIVETLGYDGLGRVTGDGQAEGSTAYQYDLAGRRTKWPKRVGGTRPSLT